MMLLRIERLATPVRPLERAELTDRTNYVAMDYPIQTPTVSLDNILDSIQQGRDGEITVTETIAVLVLGATKDIVAANINKLERLLMTDAPLGHRRTGPMVQIAIRVDGQTQAYRSQILSGRLEVDERWHLGWAGRKVEVRLHIQRRYYWESTTATELSIYSAADLQPGVGGKLINNDVSNTVVIPAGHVGGVLPTPARIWLKNTTTTQRLYRNIYLACDVQLYNTATYSRLIQAESKIPTSSGAIVGPPFAGASGDSILRLNTTANGVARPVWASTLAQGEAASGRSYRILARVTWYTTASGQSIFVAPALTHGSATSANLNPYNFEYALLGPPTQLQTELHDLGTVAFPSSTGEFPPAPLNLGLFFRTPAAATVEIDFVHPLPAENFRHLSYVGEGVVPGQYIVDDGIEGESYATDAFGRRAPVVSGRGRHLMLWPQTRLDQKIFVLSDLGAQAPTNLLWTVRVFHRPRRLTI